LLPLNAALEEGSPLNFSIIIIIIITITTTTTITTTIIMKHVV